MNTLMMTLQQPVSVAALAQCLGWGPAKAAAPAAVARRRRLQARNRTAATRCNTPNPLLETETGEEDDASKGCGWFDSSRDLHQGLVVLEHSGVENLGAELPITVWLGLVLQGPAAAATADAPGLLTVRA